jgi:hypothetical protein
VTPLDYEYLRKLLKDRSGLLLSSDKQYLIESGFCRWPARVACRALANWSRRSRTAPSG